MELFNTRYDFFKKCYLATFYEYTNAQIFMWPTNKETKTNKPSRTCIKYKQDSMEKVFNVIIKCKLGSV